MINFILLFFPTFITLNIINKEKKLEYKDMIIKYPVYNIIINTITFMVITIIKNNEIIILSESTNYLSFCLKYLLVSTLIAIFLPFIKRFLEKNIKLEIELRKNEKKK